MIPEGARFYKPHEEKGTIDLNDSEVDWVLENTAAFLGKGGGGTIVLNKGRVLTCQKDEGFKNSIAVLEKAEFTKEEQPSDDTSIPEEL